MFPSRSDLFSRSRPGRIRGARNLALVACFLAVLAVFAPVVRPNTGTRPTETATVHRASFTSLIVASGVIESTNNTEIRCTLERLTNGTTPTILSLVDDGTNVKKGDLLAELDSADFKEMVRQQSINLQQVRSSHRQATLDLEVAQIALDSFRKGEMYETDRLFRGQISLAESDVSRQADRLKWTHRMVAKGYASVQQVTTEEQTMLRSTLSLTQSKTAFLNYTRYTAPKTIKALESQVNGARSALDYQTIRLNREEERMQLYQRMVENCSVRAPHDGFVIYANQTGRAAEIFEGAPVRQRQRLFKLPDLGQMEIQALIHETVVNRVKPGMTVVGHLEALPGVRLEGVVSAVSPFPLNAKKSESGSDVTYFLGRVRLTSVPPGLRPGMTTELDITTTKRQGVLAVPQTAVVRDGEATVCTVRHADHLERRPVTLGEASHNLVEVTEGLSEGEVVILDNSLSAPSLVHAPPPVFAKSDGDPGVRNR